jgi:hypothetical protein
VYQFIAKLITGSAPWTSWTVQKGWPESDVLKHFAKPIIYLDDPLLTETKYWQMGGLFAYQVSVIVGCYNDRTTGGLEELGIICGHLVEKFLNPSGVRAVTFNVTLGATTFTATTLKGQEIRVQNISGPRGGITTDDLKEFRKELELTLKVGV